VRVTIVEPAHRGQRLGLIVKSANHAFARAHEQALRVVDAWNAEENTHMRAVNAMPGFQQVDGWSVSQPSVLSNGGIRTASTQLNSCWTGLLSKSQR
jgi:hypothetical protein